MAKCPNCGSENPDYAFYCGKCSAELKDSSGKPYVTPRPTAPPEPRRPASMVFEVEREVPIRTINPMIGGGCVILSGLLAVVQGVLMLIEEIDFMNLFGSTGVPLFWGVGFIVVGMGAILLGSRTTKRISYAGSLIGAILGIVGIGLGIGPFLGLAGLVLIALSRNEFST